MLYEVSGSLSLHQIATLEAHAFVSALPKVDRFSMVVMLLPCADKAKVAELLQVLGVARSVWGLWMCQWQYKLLTLVTLICRSGISKFPSRFRLVRTIITRQTTYNLTSHNLYNLANPGTYVHSWHSWLLDTITDEFFALLDYYHYVGLRQILAEQWGWSVIAHRCGGEDHREGQRWYWQMLYIDYASLPAGYAVCLETQKGSQLVSVWKFKSTMGIQ